MPTDLSYIEPAYKAFTAIKRRMYKANASWREPGALRSTLEGLGYKRAYLVPWERHGGTATVLLRKGLSELEPSREPVEYTLSLPPGNG